MPKKKKFKLNAAQRKWIKALRSGDYKQTQGVLTRRKEFKNGKIELKHCCLGVACEVFKKPLSLREEQDNDFEHGPVIRYGKTEQMTAAPDEVIDCLNLNDELGSFRNTGNPEDDEIVAIGKRTYNSLADMNDGGKLKFNDIADFIELYPEFVFAQE